MTIVLLQLKIKKIFGELLTYRNSNTVMPIHSDDK